VNQQKSPKRALKKEEGSMRSVCVVDNSTLITLTRLYQLSIFSQLTSLFERIHIPLKVKEEYENEFSIRAEPNRKLVLSQMSLNSGFLSICSKYDTISLVILKTTEGIDAGEAEAAAQHKTVNSRFVLSDDKKFILGLKKADPHIKVIGTIHLIAWLDISRSILDPKEYFKIVYKRIQFDSKMLRAAYREIYMILRIPIDKRLLSKKTSLKTLGIR
jgi:predicted nucleic acid-binding protein